MQVFKSITSLVLKSDVDKLWNNNIASMWWLSLETKCKFVIYIIKVYITYSLGWQFFCEEL